jgi:hypothetical protein
MPASPSWTRWTCHRRRAATLRCATSRARCTASAWRGGSGRAGVRGPGLAPGLGGGAGAIRWWGRPAAPGDGAGARPRRAHVHPSRPNHTSATAAQRRGTPIGGPRAHLEGRAGKADRPRTATGHRGAADACRPNWRILSVGGWRLAGFGARAARARGQAGWQAREMRGCGGDGAQVDQLTRLLALALPAGALAAPWVYRQRAAGGIVVDGA